MTGSGDGAGNGDGRDEVDPRGRVADAAGPNPADVERKRRLGGFLNHLIVFFVVMIVVTPVNAALDPHFPWFLIPLLGWAVPLGFHLAYVLGRWGGKLPVDPREGSDDHV